MNSMKGNKPIGKIVLSLDNNFLLQGETLINTPSLADGLDRETEIDLRILGCEMIQTTGILLKLPQVAMGTGQVLFQRFYFAASFIKRPLEVTAMACIYLASKIEEAPRRIRDIMNVFHHCKQMSLQKCISPLILDNNYILQKNMIIKIERRILKELGFSVHVKHPHKLIVVYLQILAIDRTECIQMAWNYMNDALRTSVFVQYQPETIACACIYLSARMLKVCLPESPPWFALFKVPEADIKEVCFRILHLYQRSKPNPEHLLRKVTYLERKKEDAMEESKKLESNNHAPPLAAKPVSLLDANGFQRKQSDKEAMSKSNKNGSSEQDENSVSHNQDKQIRHREKEDEEGRRDRDRDGYNHRKHKDNYGQDEGRSGKHYRLKANEERDEERRHRRRCDDEDREKYHHKSKHHKKKSRR